MLPKFSEPTSFASSSSAQATSPLAHSTLKKIYFGGNFRILNLQGRFRPVPGGSSENKQEQARREKFIIYSNNDKKLFRLPLRRNYNPRSPPNESRAEKICPSSSFVAYFPLFPFVSNEQRKERRKTRKL